MNAKGYETARALLKSYESLAVEFSTAASLEASRAKSEDRKPILESNLNFTFGLLVLNASIIEGALRTFLSEIILNDLKAFDKKALEKGPSFGKGKMLMDKFIQEIELKGGWENLNGQYAQYLDMPITALLSDDIKEGIDALFVIRNVVAHGTAVIQPKEPIESKSDNPYFFNWQRKLQSASVYLKKKYRHEEFYANLSETDVPNHFMELTKKLMENLSARFTPLPDRTQKTYERIKEYKFGFKKG